MFTMLPAIVGQGAATGLWTPASLPNLYAWYKSDAPGNTYSGTTLLTLADLSPNGRTGTAAGIAIGMTPSAINGRSAVRTFTATGAWVDIANSRDLDQNKTGLNFAVLGNFNYTGTNLGHLLVADTPTSGTSRAYVRYPNGTASRPALLARRLDTDTLATLTTTSAFSGISAALFNLDYSATSAEIRWNGSSVALSSSFLTAGLSSNTLGNSNATLFCTRTGSNSAQGDWGEIVISDAPLSSANALRLEGYVMWQWGQQGSLPVGHPYKSAPP